jgi:hypothetical protein
VVLVPLFQIKAETAVLAADQEKIQIQLAVQVIPRQFPPPKEIMVGLFLQQ